MNIEKKEELEIIRVALDYYWAYCLDPLKQLPNVQLKIGLVRKLYNEIQKETRKKERV